LKMAVVVLLVIVGETTVPAPDSVVSITRYSPPRASAVALKNSFRSRLATARSTYAFVAASCDAVGSKTEVIFCELADKPELKVAAPVTVTGPVKVMSDPVSVTLLLPAVLPVEVHFTRVLFVPLPVTYPANTEVSNEIESEPTSIPVPAPMLNVTLVPELSAPPPINPFPAINDAVDSAFRMRTERVVLVAWVSRASRSRQARIWGSGIAARALPSLTLLVAHSLTGLGRQSLG